MKKTNNLLWQSSVPSIDEQCLYFDQILKLDNHCTLGYHKYKFEPSKLVLIIEPMLSITGNVLTKIKIYH